MNSLGSATFMTFTARMPFAMVDAPIDSTWPTSRNRAMARSIAGVALPPGLSMRIPMPWSRSKLLASMFM